MLAFVTRVGEVSTLPEHFSLLLETECGAFWDGKQLVWFSGGEAREEVAAGALSERPVGR